jgi:hypothetical protein
MGVHCVLTNTCPQSHTHTHYYTQFAFETKGIITGLHQLNAMQNSTHTVSDRMSAVRRLQFRNTLCTYTSIHTSLRALRDTFVHIYTHLQIYWLYSTYKLLHIPHIPVSILAELNIR